MLSRAFRHEALLIRDLHTVKLILYANITGTQRALCLSRLKLACQDDPPGLLYQRTGGNGGRWAGSLMKWPCMIIRHTLLYLEKISNKEVKFPLMRHNHARNVQHTVTAKSACTTDKVLTESSCSHEHNFSEMRSSHFSSGETKWQHLMKQALRPPISGLNYPFIEKGYPTTGWYTLPVRIFSCNTHCNDYASPNTATETKRTWGANQLIHSDKMS